MHDSIRGSATIQTRNDAAPAAADKQIPPAAADKHIRLSIEGQPAADVRVPKLPLPDDPAACSEEAAEREKIRREIQAKMSVMRKKMSEEKAAPSPAPAGIKSPVSFRSPSRALPADAPASSGSAASKDGDTFWKNLLSDLKLIDNGESIAAILGQWQRCL